MYSTGALLRQCLPMRGSAADLIALKRVPPDCFCMFFYAAAEI